MSTREQREEWRKSAKWGEDVARAPRRILHLLDELEAAEHERDMERRSCASYKRLADEYAVRLDSLRAVLDGEDRS